MKKNGCIHSRYGFLHQTGSRTTKGHPSAEHFNKTASHRNDMMGRQTLSRAGRPPRLRHCRYHNNREKNVASLMVFLSFRSFIVSAFLRLLFPDRWKFNFISLPTMTTPTLIDLPLISMLDTRRGFPAPSGRVTL